MASTGNSMLLSFLMFTVVLSLEVIYRGKLASSELFTILGGFISSLLFLFFFIFIANFQESSGTKTGWGAVIVAELVALVVAGTVHRVCITTWVIYLLACWDICYIAVSRECSRRVRFDHTSGPSFFDYTRFSINIFLFSAGLLYEVNKLSAMMQSRSELKSKRH